MKNKIINSKYLLVIYPLCIILGKIIRWTIMHETLISYSKGWGYIDNILQAPFRFQLFGIKNIMSMSSDAWGNTVAVLQIIRKIFFDYPNTFIEFEVVLTVLFSFILLVMFTKIKESLNVIQTIVISFMFIILNVYTFVVTKELVQIMCFIAIYFVLTSCKISVIMKYGYIFLIIILSVIIFRVYYILMIYFSIAFLVILVILEISKINTKNNILVMFSGMCLAYFVFILGLRIFSSKYYNTFCFEMLSADANELGANTYIHNIILADEWTSDNNIFLVFIEYILVVLRLSFPVELIFLGIKYIPYVIFQVLVSVLVIKEFSNKNNNQTINIALMLYFAFLFMSASFEVDFGTWLRHQTVMYPVLFIIVGITKTSKKIGG